MRSGCAEGIYSLLTIFLVCSSPSLGKGRRDVCAIWVRTPSDRTDWVQRRKSVRKPVSVAARLRSADNSVPLCSCQVCDISEGGARLRLECPADVPEDFILVLSPYGQAFRYCQ